MLHKKGTICFPVRPKKTVTLMKNLYNSHIMKNMLIATTVLIACIAFVGCANNTSVIIEPEPLSPAGRNFQAHWQSSIDVLRKANFTIGQADRREGVIYTHELVGKTFGEFWRSDAAGARNAIEGTLHKVYRTVVVEIKPTSADGETFYANVTVRRSLSNKPGVQITSPSETRYLYGSNLKGRTLVDENNSPVALTADNSAELESESDSYKTELGRDKALEASLKARIEKSASKALSN